ncbi:MAG: hypothetical protein J7K85_03035 [Anaerolineaceae bacterium]|nr:hypothetical protein [Anaerolineaceae bacterium]
MVFIVTSICNETSLIDVCPNPVYPGIWRFHHPLVSQTDPNDSRVDFSVCMKWWGGRKPVVPGPDMGIRWKNQND